MGSTNPRQLAKNSIREQAKSESVREQWFLLQVPSLSSLSDGLWSGSLSPISPFLPWVAFGLNILSQPQKENPHCHLLPGRCVCQPSFTRRNNSRQISASLHNHQRTQGQNNYTLKSQERNANWDVKKKPEYSEESRDLLPLSFIISQACFLYCIVLYYGYWLWWRTQIQRSDVTSDVQETFATPTHLTCFCKWLQVGHWEWCLEVQTSFLSWRMEKLDCI